MQKSSAVQSAPEVKPKVVIRRRASEISTPSILKAMQAQADEIPVSENEPSKLPVNEPVVNNSVDQPFTLETLHEV